MSLSAPWTLKQQCRCGHHKDTHFESKYTCLGVLCECKKYRSPDEPDIPSLPVVEEKAPDTDPAPGWWPGAWTFPLGTRP